MKHPMGGGRVYRDQNRPLEKRKNPIGISQKSGKGEGVGNGATERRNWGPD